MCIAKRFLQWVELFRVIGEAFDRADLMSIGLNGKHQTGADRFAVQQDRAGSAGAVFAAHMGPGEFGLVAQIIGQKHPGFHDCGMGVSIQGELYLQFVAHRFSSCF
jgi:hypothetical protein